MRESSPPEAMRASGRASSPAFPEKRNSAWSTPRGAEAPPVGADRQLPAPRPLPHQADPEHRGLEVEGAELGQHRGLEPRHRLLAPLGQVRGARDQLAAQPVDPLREPSLVLAGAPEALEVRLDPRSERQDRLHALPVLPLQPADLVGAALDRLEPRRVEHDAVAVAAQGSRRLVQLDQGRLERLERRLDRGVDPGHLAEERRHASRPLHRGRRVVVELPVGRVGALGETLGVHEPAALVAQLLLLADPEARGVDLRDRLAVLGRSRELVARGRAEGVELRRHAPPLVVALAQPVAEDPQTREGVQEIEVPGRAEQRLVLALAVDLHQRLAELLQQCEGGVRVVQEHPAAPPAHQLPPDHERPVLGRDPVLLQDGRDRALAGGVEHRLDGGASPRPSGSSPPAGPARRGGGRGRRSGSTCRPRSLR